MKRQFRCGEIYMCEIAVKSGSVQYGYRPVFIISNNKSNTYSTILNVIPLTSKMEKKSEPTHVRINDYEKYGLRKPSMLLVEQITTISVESIKTYVGKICDEDILENIKSAMCIQIPILVG